MKAFTRYIKDNNVVSIVPADTENSYFADCDITGVSGDTWECTVVDAAGNEWSADILTHLVVDFTNGDI